MNPQYKEITYHQLMKKIEVLNELTLDEAWGIGGLLPGKSSAAKESERKRSAGETQANTDVDNAMGDQEKRKLQIDMARKADLDAKKLAGGLTSAETAEHSGIDAEISTSRANFIKTHQGKLEDAQRYFDASTKDPNATTAQRNLARKKLEISKGEHKETKSFFQDEHSYDKKETDQDRDNIEQGNAKSKLGMNWGENKPQGKMGKIADALGLNVSKWGGQFKDMVKYRRQQGSGFGAFGGDQKDTTRTNPQDCMQLKRDTLPNRWAAVKQRHGCKNQ